MNRRPEIENPLTSAESLATEAEQGGMDDLPKRLVKYANAHLRALSMSDYLLQRGEPQLAQKLDQCGAHLLFHFYTNHNALRLHAANFCHKHLICPLCAIRRGVKSMQVYEEKIKLLMANYPTLRASMVTATIVNGVDLAERTRHLKASMTRWTSCRRKAGYENWEIQKMLGSVWSYEVKRGSGSGLWHPHAHMVWLHHDDLELSALKKEWEWATGDSFNIHHTPIIPDPETGSLIAGMMEVFKYALKFSDMSLDDNWHAFETLSNKRLISSSGLLHGLKIPEKLTDDELDGPFIEMLFQFTRQNGYVQQWRNHHDHYPQKTQSSHQEENRQGPWRAASIF